MIPYFPLSVNINFILFALNRIIQIVLLQVFLQKQFQRFYIKIMLAYRFDHQIWIVQIHMSPYCGIFPPYFSFSVFLPYFPTPFSFYIIFFIRYLYQQLFTFSTQFSTPTNPLHCNRLVGFWKKLRSPCIEVFKSKKTANNLFINYLSLSRHPAVPLIVIL